MRAEKIQVLQGPTPPLRARGQRLSSCTSAGTERVGLDRLRLVGWSIASAGACNMVLKHHFVGDA